MSARKERHAWIARARDCAIAIAREKGSVTVNDVREACPPPEGADPRIMGAVLLAPQFARIGMRPSDRRTCHGRPIGVFTLRH
jgi:hypothetical protein